jgi:hypothetical protein
MEDFLHNHIIINIQQKVQHNKGKQLSIQLLRVELKLKNLKDKEGMIMVFLSH